VWRPARALPWPGREACQRDGALAIGGDIKLFGSSHPGRINTVFADGSVRPISYAIDPNVFYNLGDKSDGEVINTGDS
jgi:prepilin-type processing-associated H-X9-DG protein